ncbi:unnamed protein product [Brassicogethes aeneus]|uniref:Alanine--tRNA ligase n=1 Tax=Brassicogethes aeneus TaxID=1431903 RepID=A0A9P0AYS2_BRAAE|nr:unnamed protein product [Brassicogethes aeneus]
MFYLIGLKVCPLKSVIKCQTRKISKFVNKDVSSKAIRRRFLEYFIEEKGHNFVRSSPVVPFCDPTVSFVNAGMNQFKGIFLGKQVPQFAKVANSQKCIRVGGKHNDLNVVGSDGYHQTFFEMLGNWSFGDYSKNTACLYAWDLLTNVFKLPPSRLYVTYFEGDNKLGIPEDTETKEIWRMIGVQEDRILPFGAKDNFWEMGLTGPCGTCTEIHIDNRETRNRSEFVNKGLHDLIEVWNIVFIGYNRQTDGSIAALPNTYVDTGMGFERLTSVLQGKISNYDTDNFSYILNRIHKSCNNIPEYSGKFGETDWDSLDTNYRILADHARMISVCLSDGIIPEQNQKLRRVLRKSFLLSENVFLRERGLLKELCKDILENLGDAYPEMHKNENQVNQILDYEEEVYRNIREKAIKDWKVISANNPKLESLEILESPSLVAAYKDITLINPKEIDSKLAFKLYDTHGLDEESIEKLSVALNLPFNAKQLEYKLQEAKTRSKEGSLLKFDNLLPLLSNFSKTNDDFKYNYVKNGDTYIFPDVPIKVLSIIHEKQAVKEIKPNHYCSLLLDNTNLYSEAGGQSSDKGLIHFQKGGTFEVVEIANHNGYIIHKGFFRSQDGNLKTDTKGQLSVLTEDRLNTMRNHTCVHLLNAVIKEFKGATCQKSSKVADTYLNLDVAIFGSKLTMNEVKHIEDRICSIIKERLPVDKLIVDSQQLLSYDQVTLIPGEIYPETDIRLIEVYDENGLISREPCCGTHVFNTGDLEDFCIINLKSLGRSTASIIAVTGKRAKLAMDNAVQLRDDIEILKKTVADNIDKPEVLEMAVSALKHRLNYTNSDDSILPIHEKQLCSEMLENISKDIKSTTSGALKDFIELEMKDVLDTNVKKTKNDKEYVVHYLRSSMMLQDVPLQRATKLCPDLPVLVIAFADNMVKARCCVPKHMRSENFNAEKWLKDSVAAVFKSRVAPPKGQDGTLVVNMKARKVNLQDWDTLLNESLENAEKFVQENL